MYHTRRWSDMLRPRMKSRGLVGGVLAGEWPGLQVFEGVFDGLLLDESSNRGSWAVYSWHR